MVSELVESKLFKAQHLPKRRREHSTMRIKIRNNYFLISKECVCLIKNGLPQSQSLNGEHENAAPVHRTKGFQYGDRLLPATPESLAKPIKDGSGYPKDVSGYFRAKLIKRSVLSADRFT